MRYRWFVIIPLVGLLLGIGSAVMLDRFIIPAMLTRYIQRSDQSQSTTLDLRTHNQPPQNMRDLIQKIMDIANREQGQYKPVEFVQIGADDYLILIAGTQLDSEGGNDVESGGQEVTKQSSPYLRQIRALIRQYIPAGSTLHLAGHSLGGMVANTLAATPDLLDDYTIKTVTTFASPVNACPNPDVAYQRYIVEGDLVPLVHWAAIWSRLKGPLEVLKSTCEEGYAYLEQTMVDHSSGPNGRKNPHSSYEYSRDLEEKPLPFSMSRYDSLGRFAVEPQQR